MKDFGTKYATFSAHITLKRKDKELLDLQAKNILPWKDLITKNYHNVGLYGSC